MYTTFISSEVSVSFDDLQVHMLTAHHEESSVDEKTTTTQQKQEQQEAAKPLQPCSKKGCPEHEAADKRFNVCAACIKKGRRVPYCSRACQEDDWIHGDHQRVCGTDYNEGKNMDIC